MLPGEWSHTATINPVAAAVMQRRYGLSSRLVGPPTINEHLLAGASDSDNNNSNSNVDDDDDDDDQVDKVNKLVGSARSTISVCVLVILFN